MILKRISSSCLLAAVVLSGCMLGPEYQRPDLQLPGQFQEQPTAGDTIANLPWWEIFQDPALKDLIRIALAENKDLKVAAARIDSAAAQLGISRADLYPGIDVSGGARRLDTSNEIFVTSASPQNNFGLLGQLYYELDIWGKLRRATRADAAELLATEYGRRAVLVTLVSQVASAYFTMLGLEERLKVSTRTFSNRKGATNLINARFKQGVIPELDVNQAQIEQAEVGVTSTSLERQLRQAEHALNTLLGRTFGSIPRGLPLSEQTLNAEIPAGFPADLLTRRPDLAAAEEQAKAAVERIGVAEATRLPSFSINGVVGLQSRETNDLFHGDAFTWSIAGGLLGPLLDWGRSTSQIEFAEAQAREIQHQYEQYVLSAVQDVEDALVEIRTYQEEHELRASQVKAAGNASRLSRARYDDGVTSYLEVLDIERSLFDSELGAPTARERYLTAIVRLYAALGGGWIEEIPATNSTVTPVGK